MAEFQSVTPIVIRDLFRKFPHAEQEKIIKLLAKEIKADGIFAMAGELSKPEQFRLSEMVTGTAISEMFPICLRQARILARRRPDLSDEEFDRQLEGIVTNMVERIGRDMSELGKAQLREQRDRKADEERLEHGRIILAANRSGVSWKNMPAYILKEHPDWLPEFQSKPPTFEERKQLAERFRKMARDAKKQPGG
jgi:hypothetical protein